MSKKQKYNNEDVLHLINKQNPMIDYFSSLKILNSIQEKQMIHEDGITLAHSNIKFKPPRLSKGKSVTSKKKKKNSC